MAFRLQTNAWSCLCCVKTDLNFLSDMKDHGMNFSWWLYLHTCLAGQSVFTISYGVLFVAKQNQEFGDK